MTHETQIENAFIGILTEHKNQWTYRSDIKTEAALWENLRGHINRINIARLDGVVLTDSEFAQVRNEYNPNKGDVPYLNTLIEHSEHTKETFERFFPGEKFRRKIVVISDYWKRIMDEWLLPLKKEMASHEGRN